ncbi:MAG: helix-turn-helix domain-containing protein [Acidobacteria bacterium]|nr:helix-turn-helix domain-containing protein [Acidobacteriota bacterium]
MAAAMSAGKRTQQAGVPATDKDKPRPDTRRPRGRPRRLRETSLVLSPLRTPATRTPLPPALEEFLRDLGEMAAEAVLQQYRAGYVPARQVGAGDRENEPRLLDVKAAAAYLGLSPWTVRALPVPRVRLELSNGKELRRVLFDRRDLDAWIEQQKEHVPGWNYRR